MSLIATICEANTKQVIFKLKQKIDFMDQEQCPHQRERSLTKRTTEKQNNDSHLYCLKYRQHLLSTTIRAGEIYGLRATF